MNTSVEKAAGALMNLIPDIYKDVAQPGLSVLGKAIGGVVNFCVLPLNAAGVVADGVNAVLRNRLSDYAKKLERIPEEKIVEVHPQIAVPIIQKLSYTTNQDIANLFTNLLATASNNDTVDKAHPSFENIISQLSPDEARIIQYLRAKKGIQYCELKAYLSNVDGYRTLLEKSTLVPFQVKLDFPENIHAYYDNLIRLGILVDMLDVYVAVDDEYDKIKEAYHFEQFDSLIPDKYKRLVLNKSYYDITKFGRMFIAACSDKE